MKKIKLPLGPVELEGTELEAMQRHEAPNEYQLEDGSVIRVFSPVMQIIRMDGCFDPEGNPIYIVKNGNVTVTISAPPDLHRK